MLTVVNHGIKFLSLIFFSWVSISNCFADTSISASQATLLDKSLNQFMHQLDRDQSLHYSAVYDDLNQDGKPEAIVYLDSNKWCGSGGCTTLILKRRGNSWKMISKIMVTHPPIRVLSKISNGWHSISVWVQGGGIMHGYEVELDFNGKRYPLNPSNQPVIPLNQSPAGMIVIPKVKLL